MINIDVYKNKKFKNNILKLKKNGEKEIIYHKLLILAKFETIPNCCYIPPELELLFSNSTIENIIAVEDNYDIISISSSDDHSNDKNNNNDRTNFIKNENNRFGICIIIFIISSSSISSSIFMVLFL